MQVAVGGQESAAGALEQAVGEREGKREDCACRRGWRQWNQALYYVLKHRLMRLTIVICQQQQCNESLLRA